MLCCVHRQHRWPIHPLPGKVYFTQYGNYMWAYGHLECVLKVKELNALPSHRSPPLAGYVCIPVCYWMPLLIEMDLCSSLTIALFVVVRCGTLLHVHQQPATCVLTCTVGLFRDTCILTYCTCTHAFACWVLIKHLGSEQVLWVNWKPPDSGRGHSQLWHASN